MAPGSQGLEENGNGSPKATRNDKGGYLPRSRESAIWDLDGDGGKKRIKLLCLCNFVVVTSYMCTFQPLQIISFLTIIYDHLSTIY